VEDNTEVNLETFADGVGVYTDDSGLELWVGELVAALGAELAADGTNYDVNVGPGVLGWNTFMAGFSGESFQYVYTSLCSVQVTPWAT
jgi:hypothetical protein